jgi:WD40 repeat protein
MVFGLNIANPLDINKFMSQNKKPLYGKSRSNSIVENPEIVILEKVPIDTKISQDDYKMFRHKNKITQMLYDRENKFIWTCSLDKAVCAWDENGDCKKLLLGHTKPINCIFVVGKTLYSGGNDRTVREWDIEQSICKRTFDKNDNWITCIVVTTHLMICSGYEQNINIFDLKSGNKIKVLKGHQKRVVGVCVSEIGILYSASMDGVIRFWDLDSGECLKMFHCKEAIFGISIVDHLLYCTLYSEVFVLDPDSDHKCIPFVGISNFYISADGTLLCGWNRNKSSFDFVDIKTHNVVYSIGNDAMFHTCSMVFESSNLYYINGSSVVLQKVSIGKITVEKQPNYVKYQELMSYYTNVLLYPMERVNNEIEQHFKSLSSVKTLDEQISILKNALSSEIIQNIEFTKSENIETLLYQKEDFSLDFESRTELFYSKIREILTKNTQPTVILVRREALVYDTCKHFSILKRQDFLKPMYIFFQGEQGLDVGGVTREFYQLLSEQILDPRNCLFVKSGFNHTFHPNPHSSINDAHLQYFTFVGKLIGKAILDMQMMDTHFTSVLFKLILGKSIHYNDLEFVDPSLFLGMNKLLQLEDASVMDFNFVTEVNDFGMNNTYSLIENGEKILVSCIHVGN